MQFSFCSIFGDLVECYCRTCVRADAHVLMSFNIYNKSVSTCFLSPTDFREHASLHAGEETWRVCSACSFRAQRDAIEIGMVYNLQLHGQQRHSLLWSTNSSTHNRRENHHIYRYTSHLQLSSYSGKRNSNADTSHLHNVASNF
jgi:hypothetical protein